ncbi:zinc ribbon domain-containing protein [Algoriphagus sp. Y33]|uniref:zinc ribbon domain-containing protein n=1 Tax=Algoriphagus sp. Y33 TaxID=2772483 RepID=UPI00178501B6|nr:zinc ribbon domain-containing protein [Algoriphagus sp. Y33]
MSEKRFQDQNKRLSEFQIQVLVKCPACSGKANSQVSYEENRARIYCTNCGHTKEVTTEISLFGSKGHWMIAANQYFNAELWLQSPFKNDVFWAYNADHLAYLEKYIAADLREHKDRQHYTLLEKLPKFYHEAKNRAALLKIIEKLKKSI